jgi:hypothetical protein
MTDFAKRILEEGKFVNRHGSEDALFSRKERYPFMQKNGRSRSGQVSRSRIGIRDFIAHRGEKTVRMLAFNDLIADGLAIDYSWLYQVQSFTASVWALCR